MEERHDEIIIYQSQDGTVKVDVLFENETVWLTSNMGYATLAGLYYQRSGPE